jgi:3-oxoadipate enol-lactonase
MGVAEEQHRETGFVPVAVKQLAYVLRGQGSPHQRYRELLSEYSFVHYFSPGLQQPLVPAAVERLAEIRVPTLIIVGDRDSEEVFTQEELLAAGIATSRKVVVPGARHMLNMEQPEEFNRIVLEFLRK